MLLKKDKISASQLESDYVHKVFYRPLVIKDVLNYKQYLIPVYLKFTNSMTGTVIDPSHYLVVLKITELV